MNRASTILAFIILVLAGEGYGQQLPLYSQYMMNPLLINPSVAGAEGTTDITLSARDQWLGWKEAPRTYAISVHGRVFKRPLKIAARGGKRKYVSARSGRVGFGGYVFNDQYGAINRTGLNASYAYHISFRSSQLSFGLSGNLFQQMYDTDKIDFRDDDRLDYENLARKTYSPDASVGISYISSWIFTGFSALHLFEAPLKFGPGKYESLKEAELKRHYYLFSGVKLNMPNDKYRAEPSFLIKTTEVLNPQIDLNLKVLYEDSYWGGISVRSDKTVAAMFGVRSSKLYIGYSLDYSFSAISRRTYGSHEIVATYKLGNTIRRYRWMEKY